MNYNELTTIYKHDLSLSSLNISFDLKIQLINLVCFLTKQIRNRRSTNISVYDVLTTIIFKRKEEYSLETIQALSLICNDLLIGDTNGINFYGYKNATDIISKIKSILDEDLPF